MECDFCKKKLSKKDVENYESGTSNWASWTPCDKYAACNKCDKIMCEECHGPCKMLCFKCKKVCHSFMCDDILDSCNHRCKCYDRMVEDPQPTATNGVELTTLQRKRLTYHKNMINKILH